MLQALEPHVQANKGMALSPRLQGMLERNRQALVSPAKLEQRLSKVQGVGKAETSLTKEEKKTK